MNIFADQPGVPPAFGQMPRRERAYFTAVALLVLLLAWWWITAMAKDMYGAMSGSSAWMMTTVWDVKHLLLLWSMWAVMMAAMMLPSAWPMLAMYSTLARRPPPGRRFSGHLYVFAGGYLLIWAMFSVGATIVQRILAGLLLLSPMMELASPGASAAFLVIAGVYQLTPLKRVCLQSCRSRFAFLTQHWRAGRRGAFGMGLKHGMYCVGCCWALMLLLFVGGVMNLYVIAALTIFVALEKIVPAGEQGSRLVGGVLIVLAVWLLAR